MASTGPIPKRCEERRRRNTTTETGMPLSAEVVEVDEDVVTAPPADEDWNPLALEFYESCVASVQSRFYEPSDWVALKVGCETLTRMLDPQPVVITGVDGSQTVEMMKQPIRGSDLNALTKLWGVLLVTEGDRRRLRLEVKRKELMPQAPVTGEDIVAHRSGLFSIPGGA